MSAKIVILYLIKTGQLCSKQIFDGNSMLTTPSNFSITVQALRLSISPPGMA